MENSQNDEDLYHCAAQWLARLRSPSVSTRDHTEFSRWLNADPRHQAAFDDMLNTWETLGMATEIPASKWDPRAQNLSFLQRLGLGLNMWRPGPANQGYWVGGIISLAATMLLTATILLTQPESAQPITYVTAPGEFLQVVLPDQTVVELNTATELKVLYSAQERRINLLTGEAYFDVQSNKSRPFLVDVGRGTVTAVGTAFNIKKGEQEDWVAVTEGMVRVKQKKDPTTPYPESKFLRADQHLTLAGSGLGPTTHLNQHIHWLDRNLSFDNTPLPMALAELNRYLAQPVEYESSHLADLKLSGTFSLSAPKATLAAIATSFDLELDENQLALASHTPRSSH